MKRAFVLIALVGAVLGTVIPSLVSAQASVSCEPLDLPYEFIIKQYWLDDHTIAFENFSGGASGDLTPPVSVWYQYNFETETLTPLSASPFDSMPLPPELVGIIPFSEEAVRDIHLLSTDEAYIFPRITGETKRY
ncbi:MAG: hypothetical protein SGJ24_03865 [Chloroflexota bacterium]|nr:hypothetical protein [Chloroflexota bacterium]